MCDFITMGWAPDLEMAKDEITQLIGIKADFVWNEKKRDMQPT